MFTPVDPRLEQSESLGTVVNAASGILKKCRGNHPGLKRIPLYREIATVAVRIGLEDSAARRKSREGLVTDSGSPRSFKSTKARAGVRFGRGPRLDAEDKRARFRAVHGRLAPGRDALLMAELVGPQRPRAAETLIERARWAHDGWRLKKIAGKLRRPYLTA
jgi:hypothetical protein